MRQFVDPVTDAGLFKTDTCQSVEWVETDVLRNDNPYDEDWRFDLRDGKLYRNSRLIVKKQPIAPIALVSWYDDHEPICYVLRVDGLVYGYSWKGELCHIASLGAATRWFNPFKHRFEVPMFTTVFDDS